MKYPQPQNVDELLQQMVRIDSVNAAASGNLRAEAELGDYLFEVASAWKLPVERLPVADRPDNLLITVGASRDNADWLLFDSHLDTVSVDGMTIEPFGGEIDDQGRLFGRGACDTKGTGAAMLWALREYAAQPQRPNHVALLLSVDEEVSMTGIRSFIANDLPRLNIKPRGVIVGEPTLLRPVIAHNGVVRWTITTTGVAAHTAVPEFGRSAILMMNRVIHAVQARYMDALDACHPLTGRAVASFTMIRGGTQENIIPERCDVVVDQRYLPGDTAANCMSKVQAILDELMQEDAKLKVHQHSDHGAPPLDPAVNEAYLPQVRRVLARHGLDVPPVGAPFATHAGDLAAAGLPVLVLGPGDPTPAHTRNEWVSLEEIRRGVTVYRDLMGEV